MPANRVEGSADSRPAMPETVECRVAEPVPPRRVAGLDGLRGLAALYVLAFHCRLLTFPGFPSSSGPRWLGWLMYGRLAVVFFLVLSGFSLAITAANNDWRLGGLARYVRRRCWRILPPYWAALLISLIVAWLVVPASHLGAPTAETVVAYGLLLQDVWFAPTPNGAFWSIAVEAELYIVFPLLLVFRRRWGAVLLLAAVTLPVVAFGLGAPKRVPIEGANWLTPNLAPIFVLGVVAAGIVTAKDRVRRLPWHWLAALIAAPLLLLIFIKGSRWTVNHYFWIDLLAGPPMVMLLCAVATGRPRILVRILATRPMRRLGSSSYSLYLVHLPVVMIIARKVAEPLAGRGLLAFGITIALGLPLSLLAARGFAAIFELPFQRHRSWHALVSAARARLGGSEAGIPASPPIR